MIGAQSHVTDRSAAIRSIPSTWPAASSASSSSLRLVFKVRLGFRTTKRCRGLKSTALPATTLPLVPDPAMPITTITIISKLLSSSQKLCPTTVCQSEGLKKRRNGSPLVNLPLEISQMPNGEMRMGTLLINQFVSNLVDKLGYQVNTVRITRRVMNTYFAGLCFSKIVLTDAVRISYGMGRVHETKSAYDASLDSAADGPDFLIQELKLVNNIGLAIKEERYKDAAMWRDKLVKLRKSIQGP